MFTADEKKKKNVTVLSPSLVRFDYEVLVTNLNVI